LEEILMKKILVVEDDPLIMDLIVILLEHEGYEVMQSFSAEESISLAVSCQPDLVLMDVALPGLDGLEATRILKAQEGTRRIPIIALSAQAMKEDAEKASRAGCDGFIVKPIFARTFVQEISRFLEKHSPTENG
jgi:CheY-like chemotaxis protein